MDTGNPAPEKQPPPAGWPKRRSTFVQYLCLSAVGHFIWETAQLPLYTIWSTGTLGQMMFAVAHCTIGDVLIGGSALLLAILLLRARGWPNAQFASVAICVVAIGLCYTGFSEWLNVSVRQTWAYSTAMPRMAIGAFAIGLSPLAQWIVVPLLVFAVLSKWLRAAD